MHAAPSRSVKPLAATSRPRLAVHACAPFSSLLAPAALPATALQHAYGHWQAASAWVHALGLRRYRDRARICACCVCAPRSAQYRYLILTRTTSRHCSASDTLPSTRAGCAVHRSMYVCAVIRTRTHSNKVRRGVHTRVWVTYASSKGPYNSGCITQAFRLRLVSINPFQRSAVARCER